MKDRSCSLLLVVVVGAVSLVLGNPSSAVRPRIGANDFRISDMGGTGSVAYGAFVSAVAYNPTNHEYLVVWVGDDNAGGLVDGEFEIFGQRLDAATGAPVGANDFRISDAGGTGNTSYEALWPAVAYNPVDNEYLVVWQGTDNVGGLVAFEYEIFGQRLDAATGAPVGANDFRISDMGGTGSTGYYALGPAVAHNPTNNEYLVVWAGSDNLGGLIQTENEIFGQRLDAATGAPVGANDFRISDAGGTGNTSREALFPDVAYNSTGNEYLVVWWGSDNVGGLVAFEYEIFGQRLDAATGAAVGANDFRISHLTGTGDPDRDAEYPAVAYNPDDDEYFVVWHAEGIILMADDEFEIFGQRLDADGTEIGTDLRLSDMGPTQDPDFSAMFPAVSYDPTDGEYLVVWWGDDDTGGLVDNESEIFGQRLRSTGGQIGANDFRISDMGGTGSTGYRAFSPAVAHNPTNDEFLVVWEGNDDVGGLIVGETEIFGQRLRIGIFSDSFESGDPAASSSTPARQK